MSNELNCSCDPRSLLLSDAALAHLNDQHGQTLAASTWAQYRSDGRGPNFRIIAGRAYYAVADLDTWARSRVSPVGRTAADVRRNLRATVAA